VMAAGETQVPITGIEVGGGNVALSWEAMDPGVARLYASTNLSRGEWEEVVSPVSMGAEGAVVAADAPMKFFRLYAAGEPAEYSFSLSQNAPYAFASEVTGYAALQNGVPLAGIADSQYSSTNFVIYVPQGATQLHVATGDGSGDVDLYIVNPTTGTEHSNTSASNEDALTFANPVEGYWVIRLYAYGAYHSTTLTATVTGGANQGAPSRAVTLANTGNVGGVFDISVVDIASQETCATFTVSPSQLSVAAGGSDVFTVAPVAGLAVGNYSATITVDGGSGFGTRSFAVSFRVVNPEFDFSLSRTTPYAFDDDEEGYAPHGFPRGDVRHFVVGRRELHAVHERAHPCEGGERHVHGRAGDGAGRRAVLRHDHGGRRE